VLTLVESLSASPAVQPGKAQTKAQTTPPPIPLQGELRALGPGEVLFRAGDARDHIYRVESGALCLYRCNRDGTRTVLEFAFPGDLVGLGYLDSHISDAQATMETSLCCLPRAALDPATADSPRMRGRLTAAIEREVAYLKDSLVAVGRPSPLQRIAALFVTLSRNNAYEGRQSDVITDSLTCGVVAGYLGMSVDQLAARLGELEARGLIEPCAKGLRLLDLDALESLADSAA
jgi:CRP/FNR family transcriptional regulator, anaerobic regulatory protein